MGGFRLAGHVLGINNNHVIVSMILLPINNENIAKLPFLHRVESPLTIPLDD